MIKVFLIISDDNRLEEQKKWLDGEIEKVLQQRQEVEQLEKASHLLIFNF